MNVIDLTMIDSDEDAAAPAAPANTGTIDLCYSSSDEAEAGAAPNAAPTAPKNADEVPKNVDVAPERAAPLGRVDQNAAGASTLKREAAAQPPSPAKRARAGAADDEVLAVPPPARPAPPAAPQPQSGDDECQITAHSGALTDFPHSREHCTSFPIAADASKRCANCFCYVCDAPASGCKSWASHCAAVHADPAWRTKRESARRARDSEKAAATVAATAVETDDKAIVSGQFSTAAILRRIERVYPEETPTPRGFRGVLRPYQRQSLAFALNRERGAVTGQKTHFTGGTRGVQGVRGGIIADEVGMGKTAVAIALVLANPSSNKRASDSDWENFYRVLTQKPPPPATIKEQYWHDIAGEYRDRYVKNPAYLAWRMEKCPGVKINFGATIVATSPSLIGQWEDEIRKFAPGLNVQRFYGSNRHTKGVLQDWRDVDVIVTSLNIGWGKLNHAGNILLEQCSFHRIIADECHTSVGGSINDLSAERIWGLTGTPFAPTSRSLEKQLRFVGMFVAEARDAIKDYQLYEKDPKYLSSGNKERMAVVSQRQATNALAAALRKVVMRHSKSQRIRGAAALALPDASSSTIKIDMPAAERPAYNQAKSLTRASDVEGKTLNHAENLLSGMRGVCAHSKAKVELLLQQLRAATAAAKARGKVANAVVFTGFDETHSAVVARLKLFPNEFRVFKFSSGTQMDRRHHVIRAFQSTLESNDVNAPTHVFVITVRAGACGVTLTAATSVYILEPQLNPVVETQCAGRAADMV